MPSLQRFDTLENNRGLEAQIEWRLSFAFLSPWAEKSSVDRIQTQMYKESGRVRGENKSYG